MFNNSIFSINKREPTPQPSEPSVDYEQEEFQRKMNKMLRANPPDYWEAEEQKEKAKKKAKTDFEK